MILTFMSQNLQFAGLSDGEGNTENRWPALLNRIKSVQPQPDFLLLEETWDWDKYGHKHLVSARDELKMDTLPLPPASSGNGTGLLYRSSTVGQWQKWNTNYAEQTMHGFGVAAFDVGLPSLLSIVTTHLNPFASDLALGEIGLITTRAYRYGPFAIIGGDLNYPPSRGPEPDYTAQLPYNTAARTLLTDPAKREPLTPDRRIGWKLEQAGFVDVAYYMYQKTKDEKLLERTAAEDRIDQFWVSKPLADGIINYWVVGKPEKASDHKGIVFQLDTDKVETSDNWVYV